METMLLTSIISISNYTFIAFVIYRRYMFRAELNLGTGCLHKSITLAKLVQKNIENYENTHCLRLFVVIYKHVTMTSPLWLRIPTHPQNFKF